MAAPEHVVMWIDKCQQNIERMQRNGISPAEFRQQYQILATIVRVIDGDAYFAGTRYHFPAAAPPPQIERK